VSYLDKRSGGRSLINFDVSTPANYFVRFILIVILIRRTLWPLKKMMVTGKTVMMKTKTKSRFSASQE